MGSPYATQESALSEFMKFDSGFHISYPWIPIEYNKGNAQFQ